MSRGLSHGLDRGIKAAAAPYFARTRQDNPGLPRRGEPQFGVVNQHVPLGTRATQTGESAGALEPSQVGATLSALSTALRDGRGFWQEYCPAHNWCGADGMDHGP